MNKKESKKIKLTLEPQEEEMLYNGGQQHEEESVGGSVFVILVRNEHL